MNTKKKITNKNIKRQKKSKTKAVEKKQVPDSVKPKPVKAKNNISLPLMGADGKRVGSVSARKALFGIKPNIALISQAVRVYLSNQRTASAHTKTRGEVTGSTRKIYRQKGTGRARHGGIRAPIFVGGGIVFGPRDENYKLNMPKKMKKAAFASALSYQNSMKNIIIFTGLEKKIEKTKKMQTTIANIVSDESAKVLLVISNQEKTHARPARNVSNVDIINICSFNTYAALKYQKLIITKSALKQLNDKHKD